MQEIVSSCNKEICLPFNSLHFILAHIIPIIPWWSLSITFILVKGGRGKCCAFIVTNKNAMIYSNAEIGPTNFDHSSLNQNNF